MHHLDIAKARAILAKYELKGHESTVAAPQKALMDYDWDAYAGFDRLRAEAFEALKKGTGARSALEACRPSAAMLALCTFVIGFFLTNVFLAGTTGQWRYVLAAGLGVHWLMGVGHNFFHKAETWWPLRHAFDLTSASAKQLRRRMGRGRGWGEGHWNESNSVPIWAMRSSCAGCVLTAAAASHRPIPVFSSDEWRISHVLSHHLDPVSEQPGLIVARPGPVARHQRGSPFPHRASLLGDTIATSPLLRT